MAKQAAISASWVRAAVGAGAVVWALGFPAVLSAQDAPGGRQITFGIDSRIVAQTNADLTPGGTARTQESTTRLSFGFRTQTPASFVALEASAALRVRNRMAGGNGLTDPSFALAFRREAAGSFLTGTAYLRETDLTQADTLDLLLPPVGTQRRGGGTLAYRWGEDRRAGFGLTASATDTRYRNAPGQIDNRRYSLGGDVRLDLSEVTQLTVGLTRSRYDPVIGARRDTTALTADMAIDRPRGPVTLAASLTRTPDGRRGALSVGRVLDLADGQMSGGIGVTRGVTGTVRLTGALGYVRDLPDGRITAALSRSVTTSEDDREAIETRASLGYARDLTDRTRLSLDFGLGESRATSTGISVRSGTFGATLSHELDPNWVLDTGYRQRRREVTGLPSATNSAVFVSLRRQFVMSF